VKSAPHVSQQQGDAHKQQSQRGVPRVRADTALVHLPVAGLDAEPLAVFLADPRRRTGLESPERIHQPLAAVPLSATGIVAAVNSNA